ncbi:MAG: AraC family transcriptional regulator [Cellulosilyticaceae bacterium]
MHNFEMLEGFRFKNKSPDEVFCRHFYKINELGCMQVPDQFKIIRDGTYPYHVLHYVYGGRGILSVNNQHYKIQVGDCFILGTGKPHLYASEETNNLKVIWLEFYGNNTTELVNLLLGKNIHVLHEPYTTPIASLLVELIKFIQSVSDPNDFDLTRQMYALLVTLIEQGLNAYADNPNPTVHLPLYIEKSLTFIAENLCSNIKIRELADYVNCHPSYFSRSFSAYIGISPYKYILIKKIEYAISRILDSEVTATQLADELGFVDTTHFTKVFKKITGQSISEYKKMNLL